MNHPWCLGLNWGMSSLDLKNLTIRSSQKEQGLVFVVCFFYFCVKCVNPFLTLHILYSEWAIGLMTSCAYVVSCPLIIRSGPLSRVRPREQQQQGDWPSLGGSLVALLVLQLVSGNIQNKPIFCHYWWFKCHLIYSVFPNQNLTHLAYHFVDFISQVGIFLPCRRCCWRPLGLLADQWTIQTAASGVNGAQSSATAEAVWWYHGRPWRHPVDRFDAIDCSCYEQWPSEAAAHRCRSRICDQGAPGRGTLCGLVSI